MIKSLDANTHFSYMTTASGRPGRLGPRMMRRRAQERRRNILFFLSLGIMGVICFGTYIIVNLVSNWRDEAYYESLSESFALAYDPVSVEAEPEPVSDFVPYEEESELELGAESNSAYEERVRTSVMDFESKRHETPGIEGWIKIDGTSINYPIMYASDNDYFLTRLPNGKKSGRGSIFIDYRNSPNFSNPNTLIYGHRMKSGAMFGMLKNYSNQSFYDKYPTVSIFTPGGDFEVELFAGYAFDQTVETLPLRFKDDADFDEFTQSAKRRSIFKSDVEVRAGDRLVSLCTCEYSNNDGRLVIMGKLIEK